MKLIRPKPKKAGRSGGKITTRHRGGGAKRLYRIVDFKRGRLDIPAKVKAIKYDPNRTANIALIVYADGRKSYILAPTGLKVTDIVVSAEKALPKLGNRMKLKNIPIGTSVYNVELKLSYGGQVIRSAGSSAQVLAKEGKYVHLKLPSGEIRKFLGEAMASIGQVSCPKHNLEKLRKAGQNRWRGKRPTVRGSAMSPRAHPHGGGEGRSPIGLKHPKTPWGKPALGFRTRKKNKPSNKYIIQRRKSRKKR